MNRREKIIAVILVGIVGLWIKTYFFQGDKQRRNTAVPRPAEIQPPPATPAAPSTPELPVEDILSRVAVPADGQAQELKNDPFLSFALKTEGRQGPLDYSDLLLNGIVWEEESPVALINGQMVKVGATIAGFTVEAIRPNEVEVKKDQEKHILFLYKEKEQQ